MKRSFGKNPFGIQDKFSDENSQASEPSDERSGSGLYGDVFPSKFQAGPSAGGSSAGSSNPEPMIDTITGYPRSTPSASPAVKNLTVINSDTQLKGDLKTQGDINVMGTVDGNVETQGNLVTSGTINGNVTAGSLIITSGKITGEFLHASGNVKIDSGSSIQCSIKAGSLEASGRINGDIVVDQAVVLNETAVINGNISSKHITIKEGARLNGALEIGKPE